MSHSFRTSTARLIGVQLDLIKLKLRFWINGKPLENNKDQKHIKDIPAGKQWLPTVIIQEEGLAGTVEDRGRSLRSQ